MGTIEQAPAEDVPGSLPPNAVEFSERLSAPNITCLDSGQLTKKLDDLQDGKPEHFWPPEGESATDFARGLARTTAGIYFGRTAVIHTAPAANNLGAALRRLARNTVIVAFVNHEGATAEQRAAVQEALQTAETPAVFVDVFPAKQE